MINFREIFNTTYGYLGLIIIFLLILILFIFNKNYQENFKLLSKIFVSSSIIILILDNLIIIYNLINIV